MKFLFVPKAAAGWRLCLVGLILVANAQRAAAAISVVAPPPALPAHPLTGAPDPRFVYAAATGVAPAGTTDDSFGHFLASVAVAGASPGGALPSASASQDSTTPPAGGPTMSGSGKAIGSVTTPPGIGDYSLGAVSFFDVFFTVTAPDTYFLTGSVDSHGTFPPTAVSRFAQVALFDFDSPTTPLFSEISDPSDPGTHPFSTALLLTTGVTYRLRAEAIVFGGGAPGAFSNEASWDFRLSSEPVPEPASWCLMAGLASLLPLYRRRRRLPH